MTKLEQAAQEFAEASAAFNRCTAAEEVNEREREMRDQRASAIHEEKYKASDRKRLAREALIAAALAWAEEAT